MRICSTNASGAHAPSVSNVASFLSDIGDEISEDRFRAYIAEIKDLMPARAFADLEDACQHLAAARSRVRRAVSHLADC